MLNRMRYLAIFFSTIGLFFVAAWIYSIVGRFGFSESEYAVWQAKFAMIERCDLGDIAVLGESRASAGFIPSTFPMTISNLALSGSGPIEAYYEWRRMRNCPRLPKMVILSYWPDMFSRLAWFWPRSARYGLFSFADLEEIRGQERLLSPGSLYRDAHGGRLFGMIYNWMHAYHFPPFDFANFASSALVGRYATNLRAYRDTLAQRGHHSFLVKSTAGGAGCATAPMAMQKDFRADPLVVHYFQQLLVELKSHGVKVLFMPTPVSMLTYERITPAYKDAFYDFIRHYGDYFDRPLPSKAEMFPVAANCGFGDGTHLDPAAARIFSIEASEALSFERAALATAPGGH